MSDRAHLLEDAFSLASAGELEYEIAMNMTGYLSQENNAIPWSVASSKLTAIDTLMSATNSSLKFKVNYGGLQCRFLRTILYSK